MAGQKNAKRREREVRTAIPTTITAPSIGKSKRRGDEVVISPIESGGRSIGLSEEGWRLYFTTIHTWWKMGPCIIHRTFRFDFIDAAWTVMVYRTHATTHDTETFLVGTPEQKTLIRSTHRYHQNRLPFQLPPYYHL